MVDDPQGKAPDPVAYRQYLAETQPEKLPAYDQYLKETGQSATPQAPVGGLIHQNAQKPGGMARLKTNIADQNEASNAEVPAAREGFGGMLANTIRDVPGGEAVTAGVHALAKGESYSDALGDVRQAEDAIPKALSIPARLAGGVLTQMAVPGSPTLSAARFGTASGLLQADPNLSLSDRLQSGAARGLTGAAIGKAFDLGSTALRSGAAPKLDEALSTLNTARSEASKPAYDAFRKLGDLGDTPALQKLIGTPSANGGVDGGLPIVRSAINTVKGQSPTLADLPDTHAEVLDAAYKIVGNKAWRAANGFTQSEARDALGNAIEQAAQAKGGSYKAALDAYSGPSAEMGAMQRGAAVLKNAVKPGGASAKQALTTSVPAFEQWSGSAAPNLQDAAQRGVLSGLKGMPLTARLPIPLLHRIPLPLPGGALQAASEFAPASGTLSDALRAAATSRSANLPPTP